MTKANEQMVNDLRIALRAVFVQEFDIVVENEGEPDEMLMVDSSYSLVPCEMQARGIREDMTIPAFEFSTWKETWGDRDTPPGVDEIVIGTFPHREAIYQIVQHICVERIDNALEADYYANQKGNEE